MMDLTGIPSKRCEEVRMAAFLSVAKDMVKDGLIEDSDVDRFAKDLARCAWHNDGFEIAKKLDDYGWEMSAAAVEILDSTYHFLSGAENDARRRWITEQALSDPFKADDKITTREGRAGYIHKDADPHYAATGFALCKFYDDKTQSDNSSWLIKWEDIAEHVPA